jgi:hypothetical protein
VNSKLQATSDHEQTSRFLFFFVSSYNSVAAGSASLNRALIEECETTSEPFEFEGVLILDVVSTPPALLANNVELHALENAIQAVFACDQESLFYPLTNVTVRLDLYRNKLKAKATLQVWKKTFFSRSIVSLVGRIQGLTFS